MTHCGGQTSTWRRPAWPIRSCRLLAKGTLNADLFRAFIAQDAFFLGAFRKAYALALARSDEAETITVLYELIGGVLEETQATSRLCG